MTSNHRKLPLKGLQRANNQPEGLHSSEYQTHQRGAGCNATGKEFRYAFFEAAIPSK
jgi:hypothetical protein